MYELRPFSEAIWIHVLSVWDYLNVIVSQLSQDFAQLLDTSYNTYAISKSPNERYTHTERLHFLEQIEGIGLRIGCGF